MKRKKIDNVVYFHSASPILIETEIVNKINNVCTIHVNVLYSAKSNADPRVTTPSIPISNNNPAVTANK
jgi:hypothetical protein